MRDAIRTYRGPIWAEFTRVQNGLVIDNLARAFHLPRPKAKAAILDMFAAMTLLLDQQTLSRGALARLVEIIGKNNYELVLEDATLMGATSTQVIGSEALTILAGHSESARIASSAAKSAEISQMIAEYLLPVVAAMFLGALAVRTKAELLALARNEAGVGATEADKEARSNSAQLPVGRGSSGLFGGTTVVSSEAEPEREALYRDLAERLRNPADADPIHTLRQIIADGLGVRTRNAPWFARVHQTAMATVLSAQERIQERLRKLRSR
jgi:hypothetical protein